MFERFTEQTRQVIYIGTEHILLGFVRGNEGIAAPGERGVDLLVGVVARVGRLDRFPVFANNPNSDVGGCSQSAGFRRLHAGSGLRNVPPAPPRAAE
jgi:hypothetical protein